MIFETRISDITTNDIGKELTEAARIIRPAWIWLASKVPLAHKPANIANASKIGINNLLAAVLTAMIYSIFL